MILDNNNPQINGICYDWSSIEFQWGDNAPGSLGNTFIVEISKLNYGETRESKKNYGAGSYPVSKGQGNVDVKANMTISLFQMRKLINLAVNNKVQNLDAFDINVVYKPGNSTTAVVTDVIQGCSIDSTYFEATQNDMGLEIELNLNPTRIIYGTEVLPRPSRPSNTLTR